MTDCFNVARKMHAAVSDSKIDSYDRVSIFTAFGGYILAAGCWSRSRALALLSVAGSDIPPDIRNEILGRLAEEDDERAAEENGLINDALLVEAEEQERQADEFFFAVLQRVVKEEARERYLHSEP